MQSSLSINRRLWVLLAVVSIGGILLSGTPPSIVSSKTQAKMPQTRTRKIENYDVRDKDSDRQVAMAKHGLQSGTARENRLKLDDTMKVAQARLKKQKSNLDVEWNQKVGAPEIVGVLSSQEKLTARSNSKRSEIVRQFIADSHDLYGLTLNDVAQLKTTADYANPNGNISWVELEQQINGIPVFQGNLRAGLTKDGELIRTTGLLVPGLSLAGKRTGNQLSINSSTSSATTAAEAVAAAAGSIGVQVNPAELVLREASEDGNSYVFEPGPFAEEIKVQSVYFPLDSGAVTLAWSMILWQDIPAYYTLVDAQSGELLWRENITSDQTQSVTYSIYNGDSPAPFSPFVGLPGSNLQGAGISRTSFTHISELPAFDNLGWITDGGNTTTGNNVDAGLDLVAPNGIDPGGRPIGSPARVFDFPYNPPPLGTDPPTGTNYRAGAVTNLFFWSNRYHDILYQYGFTEPARNFQINNFGRGGLGNDFVRAEAQDFAGTFNANFSAPPDGSLPRMQMFLFPGSSVTRDGDLDQEVVLHELTHGTSFRLHNNSSGLQARISGGMGEGWSDFYARMILSSADEDVDGIYGAGGYVYFLPNFGFTDNYYFGIRRYPYAVKTNVGPNGKPHNPLTFADVDPNQIDASDGAYPYVALFDNTGWAATEVHNIGEVWCIALTEVRARLIHRMGYAAGNTRMMQLTTDAMKLDPTNPTFVSGRNSLLAADVAFGSEDALDIWAGFATRGIGFGATLSGFAYVKESFDYPIPGMGTVTATDSPCNSDGRFGVGEKLTLSIPLTNPLTNELTGVSAQVVGGGSATYGTIAPGATVAQTISYQVPSDVACGSKIKIDVVVTSNLGTETKTFKLQIGSPTPIFTENFDGVTAPALPPGWTSSVTGSPTPPSWVSSTTAADSAPNAVSISFLPTTGLSELTSPSISIPLTGAQMTFRNSINSQFGWDGGVLEISINGGEFVDILAAGGSFESDGYDWAFFETFDGNTSVLQSRAGWTGTSVGFLATTVNLPPSANGQTVRFKFRGASNSSTTVANSAWRIDSIVVNGFVCPGLATTTTADAALGQYSDSTNLSATLASSCDYPEGSMEFRVDGVLVGTVPVSGTGVYSTPYVVTNAAGSHTIATNFVSSNPYFQASSSSNTLTVSKEDASVTPFTGNPMAVQVSAPGGTSSPFTLHADINEIADGSPGDISLAMPVSMVLTPVAPGSPITCAAAMLSGGGIGGTLTAKCTFTNVPVNVYDVTITIGGNYYSGSGKTVITVFDPSLGFVTGGGVIIHNGNLAEFGFNARYKKNASPQGQLLYIEHRPTGDIILRGNVMQSLAIVGNTAVFNGKGPLNGVGNYGFRVTAMDNGEPGSGDQFGLQLMNPSGMPVNDMTFAPMTIVNGNIQVPH